MTCMHTMLKRVAIFRPQSGLRMDQGAVLRSQVVNRACIDQELVGHAVCNLVVSSTVQLRCPVHHGGHSVDAWRQWCHQVESKAV